MNSQEQGQLRQRVAQLKEQLQALVAEVARIEARQGIGEQPPDKAEKG